MWFASSFPPIPILPLSSSKHPLPNALTFPFDPETVRILQLRSPCARCTRMGRYVSAFLTLMSFLASWLSPLATLAAVTNWFLLQSEVSRPPDSLSASLNHQFPCYYLVAFRPLSPRALSCSTKLRKMREREPKVGGGGPKPTPCPSKPLPCCPLPALSVPFELARPS